MLYRRDLEWNYTMIVFTGIDTKKHFILQKKILLIVQKLIPDINSAVDLGCGVGTWLSVLKEAGTKDILGIDGNWVNKDHLVINDESFMEYDLNKEVKLNKRYDLAISLEAAEHLPPESAYISIFSLTNLSDFVLFSAAIPHQGGDNHINEQWPDYWINLFKKRGYVGFDIIRNQIWNDQLIPFWYRQNIILFSKKERIPDLKFLHNPYQSAPLSIVHPELYLQNNKMKHIPLSIKQSLKFLYKAIKKTNKT